MDLPSTISAVSTGFTRVFEAFGARLGSIVLVCESLVVSSKTPSKKCRWSLVSALVAEMYASDS